MNAEIIAVGTEILIGSIVNTNAQILSQKLASHAIDVYHHTTVGDNIPRLVRALEDGAKRADILITCGGLGPTEDDITAQSAALFLKQDLIYHRPTHQAIDRKLKKLGKKITPLLQKQCRVPAHAQAIFQNDHGTAPSILSTAIRNHKRVWLLCLPGPPRELKPLFETKALPYLLRHLKIKKQFFEVRTLKIAATESSVAEKVGDLMKLKPPATLGIYAKPGLVELKIMAKDSSGPKTKAHIKHMEKTIRSRLGLSIFGVDGDTLADAVGDLFRQQRKTLSLAESCTGGLIGHEITQSPGASGYFKGSLVAYDNSVKSEFLSVPGALIKKYGAVSPQVAQSMAKNIRVKFKTDVGLGITGIAGPAGATPSKPLGLVYIAIANGQDTQVHRHIFMGSRSDIKHRASLAALEHLRLMLLKLKRRTK